MTNNRFNNQVAIITGAGAGIGLEIANRLAHEGASVILNDVSSERAEKAANDLNKKGYECLPMIGDVSNVNFLYKMVDKAVSVFGRVDMAIANAGLSHFGDFFTYREEDFRQVVNVNIGGAFFLTQAAAKQMRKQENGGRILLMSSVTGHQAHRHLAAYSATKAAMQMLARNLVIDLSPHRITINTLAPGATLTDRAVADDPNYEQEWSNLTPTGRPSTPADVANAAIFLLSPEASQITGQTIVIDGGWSALSPQPNLKMIPE